MECFGQPGISRRALLARGTSVALVGLVSGAAPAAPLVAMPQPALFLLERGMAGATPFRASVPVVEFDGDVGEPWMEVVRPLWRRGPIAIAGLTGEGARFCIEQLGRSAGLTCTFRSGSLWLLQPAIRA